MRRGIGTVIFFFRVTVVKSLHHTSIGISIRTRRGMLRKRLGDKKTTQTTKKRRH